MSNVFERSLPTIQYCIWNPLSYNARKSGWTEQEKVAHNFFRGENMMYHSYAQSIHPMGYLERARADSFVRRLQDYLPGIECPDWAQHHKRAVDFDYEGVRNPDLAYCTVEYESTPAPHYGILYPFSICHFGNSRWELGLYAQRLFYNEEIRGNFKDGYYTEEQKNFLDSPYSSHEDFHLQNANSKYKQNPEEYNQNVERWKKLIDTYFPEYRTVKVNPTPQKFNEPFYDRAVREVTNSIFIQKWINAKENKVFSNEELQSIYEFYIHQRDEVFWVVSEEDGLHKPTPLYEKYIKALDLPSIFLLEKYTAKVVELQYNDLWQINYQINFGTIDVFFNKLNSFRQEEESLKLPFSESKKLDLYINEEVYNPLFRTKLSPLVENKKGSYVVALYRSKGSEAFEILSQLHSEAKDELYFISKEHQENFLVRVRNVVKNFPFKANVIPDIKF